MTLISALFRIVAATLASPFKYDRVVLRTFSCCLLGLFSPIDQDVRPSACNPKYLSYFRIFESGLAETFCGIGAGLLRILRREGHRLKAIRIGFVRDIGGSPYYGWEVSKWQYV